MVIVLFLPVVPAVVAIAVVIFGVVAGITGVAGWRVSGCYDWVCIVGASMCVVCRTESKGNSDC